MATKLFSLFNTFLDQHLDKLMSGSNDQKENKELEKAVKTYSKLSDTIGKISDEVDDLKNELDDAAQSFGKSSKEYKDANKHYKDALKEQQKVLDQYDDHLEKSAEKYKTTVQHIADVFENQINFGTEAAKQMLNTSKHFDILEGAAKKLGSSLLSAKGLMLDFAVMFEQAIEQVIESNKLLINSLIKSGSALRPNQVGFDYAGNSLDGTKGLLNTAAANYITPEQLLQALQAFSKGNVAGSRDLLKNSAALKEFAIQQGQLIGIYGVGADAIEKITRISTMYYGESIKDLNSEFEKSTQTVRAAGLSLKEYYTNLADLSGRAGERYFAGGTTGLNDLAETVTKLGTSTDTVLSFFDKFNNLSDVYEQQAKNAALGLKNYSQLSGQLFSAKFTGNYQAGLQQALSGLLKDIRNNGLLDNSGNIDQRGIRTLQAAGLTQQQIELLGRLNRQLTEYGLSVGQYLGQEQISFFQQVKLNNLKNKEIGLQGQMLALWAEIKSVFVDPLANVLGPALSFSLDILTVAVKALSFVAQPLISLFQKLGQGVQVVSDLFSYAVGGLTELAKSFPKIANVVGIAVKGFLGWYIYTKFVEKGILNKLLSSIQLTITKIKQAASNFNIGGSTSGIPGAKTGFSRTAKSLGVALAGGLLGDSISSFSDQGSIGDTIGKGLGNAATFGAVGAEVGSVVPGVGTAAGAIAGATLGLLKTWFEYDKDQDQKADQEKNSDRFKTPFAVSGAFNNATKDIFKSRVIENATQQQVGVQEKMIEKMAKPVMIIQNSSTLSAGIKVKSYGL